MNSPWERAPGSELSGGGRGVGDGLYTRQDKSLSLIYIENIFFGEKKEAKMSVCYSSTTKEENKRQRRNQSVSGRTAVGNTLPTVASSLEQKATRTGRPRGTGRPRCTGRPEVYRQTRRVQADPRCTGRPGCTGRPEVYRRRQTNNHCQYTGRRGWFGNTGKGCLSFSIQILS